MSITFTSDVCNIYPWCLLVLQALAAWLKQQHSALLWWSGAAVVIFRSELVLYLGLVVLAELSSRRLTLKTFFLNAIPAGIIILGDG